jgi:hypothetical protein
MKQLVRFVIFLCMLSFVVPDPAVAGTGNKKHHKHHRLFKHKKRERLKKWNAGHTEFKNRTKKEKRRLGRHHIKA